MNEVVAIHRQAVPSDPRTDDQITLSYGQSPNGPNLLKQYPQFAQDYQQANQQQQADLQPSVAQDLGAGFQSGVDSLLSSGEGALAAGSQAVGATGLRDYFLAKAQANDAAAAANPPSVPSVSDISSYPGGVGSGILHYGAYKLGQLAPNVAEAGVTSVAGSLLGGAAGGLVDPVGGEIPGAAGGALAGLFRSAAIKSLLKSYAVDSIEGLTAKIGTDAATSAIENSTARLGTIYGTHIANTMNFWAQSAGSTYNTLSKNPDVDPSTALNVSIFGGLAQAIPAQFLPSSIVKTFFGNEPVGGYFTKLVSQAAKLVPEGAAAMSLQELASIASDKYADPATRADAFDLTKWTPDDRKRLLESSITGGLAGFIGAPVAALGGKTAQEQTGTDQQLKTYTGDSTTGQQADMQALAQRDVAGNLSLSDQDLIKGFTPEQQTQYLFAKDNARTPPPAAVVPPPSAAAPGSEVVAPVVEATAKPPPAPSGVHPAVTPEEATAVAKQTPPAPAAPEPKGVAPVEFIGVQQGFGTMPSMNLYNLTEDVPGLGVKGSTLAERSIVKAGYEVPPPVPVAEPARETAPAPTPANFSEKVVGRAGPVGLQQIDFREDDPLVSEKTRRGANEPAYFTINPSETKNIEALGDRLVSKATADDSSNAYQNSKRLTAVQDNETGKVFLLSTFRERQDDSVKLADPNKIGKRAYTTRLGDLLAQKTADGEPRYEPIASLRLNELKNRLVQEFPDREAYDKAIGDPADAVIADRKRNYSGAVADKLQAAQKEANLDKRVGVTRGAVNLDEPTGEGEVPEGEEGAHEAVASPDTDEGYQNEHSQALWRVFGAIEDEKGNAVEELTRPQFERTLASPDFTDSPSAKAAFLKAYRSIQDKYPDLTELEAIQKTKDDLYENLQSGYGEEGSKAGFEESAKQSFGAGVAESDNAAGPDVASTPPTLGERAAEQQSQSEGGDKVPSSPSNLVFRKPEGVQEVTEQHARLLDLIHRAAISGGLNVQRIGQDLSGLSGEFAKRTGASYDRASRTVAQVMGTVIGKEDVVTALHEVGHDVFSKIPENLRERVLTAIDKLSDRQLGVELSADPRIRAANPKNLAGSVLAEERLVEATAQSLAEQGFSPQASQGYAQVFVRAIKDLYYKTALSVQRSLFGESFTNGTLARRFFENKVKSFLAGDFNERSSFIDMLGGGKVKDRQVAQWHSNGNSLFERIVDNDRPQYQHVPDDSPSSVRLNNLVFRQPDIPVEDQKTAIEMRVALANHSLDTLTEAGKDDAITAAAKAEKIDPVTWLAKTLKLQDPNETKHIIDAQQSELPEPIAYDKAKKINGFAGAETTGKVAESAYINGQATLGRIGKADADAAETIKNANDRREKLLQKFEESRSTLTDAHKQSVEFQQDSRNEVRKLFRDISGESKRLGVITQQLKAIDPTADVRKYAPQFQKLFAGKELEGENLIDTMDKLANDPKIDFSKSPVGIREAMANDPTYAKFTQNTPESKALFSTVVGLAKVNARVMANLELRRMASGAERVNIVNKLGDLRKETQGPFGKVIQSVARNARIEDRARVAYRDVLNEVRSHNQAVKRAQSVRDAAAAVYPIVTREQAKLAGKLSIGVGTTFADGSAYVVPLSRDASSAEIIKERDKDAKAPPGWQIHKLLLDTSQKQVSNPEQVEEHLRMMADFLNHRESQFAAGQTDAKDAVYQGVKRQFDEIGSNKNFTLNVAPYERWMTSIGILGPGEKLEQAFNTPAARQFGGMVRSETNEIFRMTPEVTRMVAKNAQLEGALLKLLPDKMANKLQILRDYILNPAKKELQSHPDLHEQYAGRPDALKAALYNKVMDKLLATEATAKYVGANREGWRNGLVNLLEHQRQSKQWLESNVRGEGELAKTVLGRQVPTGLGVLDPKLKAINIGTGELESAVRSPIGDEYTFPQKMSKELKATTAALDGSGWVARDDDGVTSTSLASDDFAKISKAYKECGEQGVHAIVDKYFTHQEYGSQVRNGFLGALAQMNTESLFDAPKQPDGVTSIPADVQKMQEAYRLSKGDPVEFLKAMYAAHGGAGDLGEYLQSQFGRMSDIALEADRISQKNEPTGAQGRSAVRGMTADYALNARTIEHLPGEWFDYHSFDQSDAFGMMKRIAAQNSYGRNGERGQAAVDTVQREVKEAATKLSIAQREVLRTNPNASPKELARLVAAKVGGESEYKRLTTFVKRQSLVMAAVRDISTYHRRDYTPDGTVNALVRAAHTIGQLMINQPSSALGLLTQMTDLNLRYGPGVAGESARGIGRVGKDLVSSLASAIGVQIFTGGENSRLYTERGLADPHSVTTFRDNFQRLDNEGRAAHFFRGVQGALATTLNPLGEKNQAIPFRPFQPFDLVGSSVDKNITTSMWNLANRYVGAGRDFYENNLDKFNDPKFKLTPDSLGLKRWDKDTFTRFSNDMQRWGLNFDDMVKSAMQRNDKTNMTSQEASRLYSMGLSEVALRGSLANFSAAWNNNPILRIASPLMEWSFRRTQQLGQIHLNAEGKFEMSALAKGIAGLSLAAGGGLAVSALMDQYYQKLVGKERNLRPIVDAPDVTQAGLGVMEDLNRIGTFGMFGELGNAVLNVGQGGDNRDLSVDQRVLAVNSLQSILQVASNFVNQGYNVDYAHVIRPLLGATGGGALIQYMQLANNALGLDNQEARVTARINAQNYLRVVGRELGMDIRVSDGGTFTPTPITPYLTGMELAAYKNSPGDFQEAYQSAIEAARKAGHDDAQDYVKRAFSERNPLRAVFSTAPSQSDYERLLANMPGSGATDVSQSVQLFNHFATAIGAKPFDGKTEKAQAFATPKRSTSPRLSLGDIRQRSTLALQ